MIIIDYYNFLYYRYCDLSEIIILKNLRLLSFFAKEKSTTIKVFFDGVFYRNIDFKSHYIQLFFTSYETADDCILKMFGSLQGRNHWLVSADKKFIKLMSSKSNICIVNPRKMWQELDFLLRCKNIQGNKKSNLIKTTEVVDDEIDSLFKRYFDK